MERTAQEAREHWAELLNTVQFGGRVVTITKHGKPAVQVTPIGDPWIITVDVLNGHGTWDRIGATEVIYTHDPTRDMTAAVDVAAADDFDTPPKTWRSQAWPGSDLNVLNDRPPWVEKTYRIGEDTLQSFPSGNGWFSAQPVE